MNYGISANEIDLYVNDKNLEYVEALIRYFDIAMRYNRIERNPLNFLLKGLQSKYDIPEKYYSHRHKMNFCYKFNLCNKYYSNKFMY